MIKKLLNFAILVALTVSAASGQLLTTVEVETAGPLGGTGSVALVPGDAVLLAISLSNSRINSYQRGGVDGLLALQDSVLDDATVNGLRQPNGLAVSPDGEFAYVSSRMDDSIAVVSVSPIGDLAWVEVQISNGVTIDGFWQNKGVAVSPDGLYVVGSGRTDPGQPQGAVALFARNDTTGQLTFLSFLDEGTPAANNALQNGGVPYFSANGFLYLVSAGGNSVTTFSINTTPNPDVVQYESKVVNGAGGVTGIAGANSILFSADGADAYVTGEAGGVAHFSVNPTTGALTFVQSFLDGVGAEGLGGARRAVINLDGDRLYVAGGLDNAIAVFARATDGGITYIGFVQDGVDGVEGLGGASAAIRSADGTYLYVAAATDNAVGVFERGTEGPGGEDAADFGDAPDPTFPTLLASDGARHTITDGTLHLGALVDAEFEGQPDALASADDTGVTDDEDGVTFVDPLDPGFTADIEVSASAGGLLDAWIDWNADGDWADAGERIANNAAVIAGVNTINVSVPATAVGEAVVMSRFRLSTLGVAGPGGLAADGEVEDHTATIGVAADLSATPSADTISGWNLPYSMTITVGNAGGSDVTAAAVSIVMNSSAGAANWTCAASVGSLCTAAGTGDVTDSVDLLAGGTAVYTITGTIADQDPGPYATATASVTAPIGTPDPILANNSGVARVLVAEIFIDGFESGNTSAWDVTAP